MSSIFTKIIEREIPAHIVAEDDNYLAFLDINPLTEGHTLVIPKKEVDYIFDLDDDTLAGLHLFAKKVAGAIESVIDCERVGVTVMGLEVPHAHVHLIPMQTMDDMNFANMKLSPSKEEMAETAKKISKAIK
ncbi:HIT family protein [Ekhidna sp.]|uniref:HIT family protein n=1 Tax=Ekhidna sp. TaxID=2608089 RepID=UPI003296966C